MHPASAVLGETAKTHSLHAALERIHAHLSSRPHWNRGRFRFALTLAMILEAFAYLRGWLHLRSARANVIPAWRAASFLLGLFLIWVAMGSPLAAFDEELLTVHMIQHLLLMTIAPPLILLGAPVMPLLHGLPRQFVQTVLGPVFRWPPAQRAGQIISQPAVCWLAASATLVGWHIPAAFTLGLQSEAWHVVEHACFLGSGFLFWWPVVQPWPSVVALAAMVDAPLPVSRHVAVRHPFWISRVLRPGRLSVVPDRTTAVRSFRSRRSAVRRCIDVDVRDDNLPPARRHSDHTTADGTEWVEG